MSLLRKLELELVQKFCDDKIFRILRVKIVRFGDRRNSSSYTLTLWTHF